MSPRKSEAELPVLIEDPVKLAEREAQNALGQFDWGMQRVEDYLAGEGEILRVSILLNLHRQAMEGIDQYAGNFRPDAVAISGSSHQPVAGRDVPLLVEEMLEYLSSNWASKSAYHLSAYAMWRLNWIHPFADGNGRTSRILSYMVMCAKIGYRIPGSNTIPEQISLNKEPYYQALEVADAAYQDRRVDVSAMEELLQKYLANQLLDVHKLASGETSPIADKIKDRSAKVGVTRESQLVRASRELKKSVFRTIEDHPAMVTIVVGAAAILVAILLA